MTSPAVPPLRVVLALMVVVTARCVCLSHGSLGEDCVDSSSCGDSLVCVLLDESVANGPRVCVPMKSVDEPQPCSEARDCAAAAFPVDATCVDGACACVGDTFAFTCNLPNNELDPPTCACVIAPDDDVDAGPDDVDAGTDD